MESLEALRSKYEALRTGMTEAVRRRWAATEATALGHGGIRLVSRATGLSEPTIRKGIRELAAGETLSSTRSRRAGAGRPRAEVADPALMADLDTLIEPSTRGAPTSPLRWTCKSTPQLAAALRAKGHKVSPQTIGRLLHEAGYSLQGMRKTEEGEQHPDRDAQFQFIHDQVEAFGQAGQPAISVDTKKKELVGRFKNAGQEWQPMGAPATANVHDFPSDAEGKAIPYGVYDLERNEAWVSVGIDHDTPAFAVATIRQWWMQMGQREYEGASDLLITADSGGSNSARAHAWKVELQRFAQEIGLRIHVCHFPPGTSKWNKIEHRLFCHVTQNWRGRPLVSHECIVGLIANTRTAKGLRVRAKLDARPYPTGVKVPREAIKKLPIERHAFHGEWNYTLLPNAA